MSALDPAHIVRLHEPRIDDHEVHFSWDVTPETELYERTDFYLRFPEELPLQAVPRALWWRVLLLCLHGQWALLRPCRVELPVTLGTSEREFWMRMIDRLAWQLEAYGIRGGQGRAAELIDAGPALEPVRLNTASDRAVVAFSGGKDSMVASALAAELTKRPLLVTITSPVPSVSRDQTGVARERALAEIGERLAVDVLEVHSDFRTLWQRDFAERRGCLLGVHEISDLPLYQGAIAAVAAASGIRHCVMASEADIQYNAQADGRLILHREFASCAATQAALDSVLSMFGLSQTSLTYPVHMPQVQALLVGRYRRLADLQFSCGMAPEGEQACNDCEKCFQIALIMLGDGLSPRVVGIDPVAVLCAYGDWSLETRSPGPRLSEYRWARHHIVRALQRRMTGQVDSILAADSVSRDDPHRGQAVAVYARMRAQALAEVMPPEPGYVTDFLTLVQADLRAPLRSILAECFPPTSEPEFKAMAKRARTLAAWIAAPLEAGSRPRSRRRATA